MAAALVAVSATFTAEAVEDSLSFWMRELRLDLPVRFAPYHQVFQQLLDPGSLLATNQGVNVILLRWEDWPASGGAEFAEALRAAASFPAPTLVVECPPSPGAVAAATPIPAGSDAVYFVSAAELARLYPVEDYYDPHGEELGHVPYTPELFAALGTMIARKVHALKRAPYKVIALDCDETLWVGVCGEDGPGGIIVDVPRRALQEFMVAQQEAGALLCLCSKNNEEDVLETFRLNPSMPLRLGRFVSRRINWEPKSDNVRALAEELELGLESFILVDDNPAESEQVRSECPEVLCLTLPEDDSEIPRFLNHVWAFDRLKVTAEDAQRTAMYAQRAERAKLERQSASLEQFLEALELKVEIGPATPEQLPRVSQLTFRTNQMNFTTVRRTENELRELLRPGAGECLTVRARDRFGDYGLVGVIILRKGEKSLTLDTFLLSCRALGKGVEQRMLARVGQLAVELGFERVAVPFSETARNKPAKTLLETIGAPFRMGVEGGWLYRFPADYLASVRITPAGAVVSHRETQARMPVPQLDYARIATELATAREVLEAVRARKQAAARPATPGVAPRTPLEQRLAALWSELLGLPSVGIDDNFFDLGGHSLLAVQLLSAVRQAFGVDLSLEVVYSGAFTVAELAKAIELYQIREAGEGEYGELLKELEGLSEDEARALLAQEENGEAPG